MSGEQICSKCANWSRGFEGMKNPSRAMRGACYAAGGRDIEDYEVTRFDESCDLFEARPNAERTSLSSSQRDTNEKSHEDTPPSFSDRFRSEDFTQSFVA